MLLSIVLTSSRRQYISSFFFLSFISILIPNKTEATSQQLALGSSYGFFWIPVLEVIRSLGKDYHYFDVTMQGSTIQKSPDKFVLRSSNGQSLNPSDIKNYEHRKIPNIKDLKTERMERHGYHNKKESHLHWKNILNIKNPADYWKKYQGSRQSFIDFFCIKGDKITFLFRFHHDKKKTITKKISTRCKPFQPSRPNQDPASFSVFKFKKLNQKIEITIVPIFLHPTLKEG